jgi:phospholipid/cholesterol/gamma-HCH transport system substrate-binding protein
MRSRWNLPIYIAYLVISLAAIGFIVMQMGITLPGSHPYAITATFADAADILNNNEVFMNGTKVGHVGDVTVVSGRAEVQLVFDDPSALPLHTDATAEVRKKNLLGETYIDVQRGSSPTTMDSGGNIPENHTVPITEIDRVLAIFDPQTVQRVQLLINAVGEATTNNGHNMNAEASSTNQLLTALNGPATELAVRQQQMQNIVQELQRFYDVLANQREQVKEEFGTWNQVMAELANQEAAIGGTVQQADALLTSFDSLLNNGTAQNLRALLDNPRNPSASLPNTLSTLDGFLNQSNQILTGIDPYRRYIGDVFPDLNTSFADKNPATGQHFWSVFSVACEPGQGGCSGSAPATYGGSSSDVWTAMGSGGAQ